LCIFLELQKQPTFWATFFQAKIYELVLTKKTRVGLRFGRFISDSHLVTLLSTCRPAAGLQLSCAGLPDFSWSKMGNIYQMTTNYTKLP
jgi:hypothetical protein